MKRSFFVIAALLTITNAVYAADKLPSADVFGGYSYLWSENHGGYSRHGWNASINTHLSNWLGLVADLSGHYGSPYAGFSLINSHRHSFLFGVNFTCGCGPAQRITPFTHVLIGFSRDNYRILDSSLSDSGMAFDAGGGLDLRIRDPIALRIIQVDYLRTRLGERYLNNGRLSFGIVWRFRRK